MVRFEVISWTTSLEVGTVIGLQLVWLNQLPSPAVPTQVMTGGMMVTLLENTPRPWVAATRLLPIQKSSSATVLAGPSLLADQVAPPLVEANTPTSVPA